MPTYRQSLLKAISFTCVALLAIPFGLYALLWVGVSIPAVDAFVEKNHLGLGLASLAVFLVGVLSVLAWRRKT